MPTKPTGDVTIIPTDDGYTCIWCPLAPMLWSHWDWDDSGEEYPVPQDYHCETVDELRAHVKEHIEAGHSVPEEWVDI